MFNSNYVRKQIVQGYPDKFQKLIKEIFDSLEDEYTEDNLLTRFNYIQEFIRDEMKRRMFEANLKYGIDFHGFENNMKGIIKDIYKLDGDV